MIFITLNMSEDGVVSGAAKGHANEVVNSFHQVCTNLLGSRGPWRITNVKGFISDDVERDSDMQWILEATLKRLEDRRL